MSQQQPLLLFKYGGNAMTNDTLKEQVLRSICALSDEGYRVVIVHGGGPFIQAALDQAGIESEFIDGHRKTTPEAMQHVEMALKGQVNGSLVGLINQLGYRAVGLSGKDGRMVTAAKRLHRKRVGGQVKDYDLGQVGDVSEVDTSLLQTLLHEGYIPVVTCIAADGTGSAYNINGDMFAGHLAGALGAEQYVVLTDVDGLLRDKDDPETLIHHLKSAEIEQLAEQGVIQGGMIPKLESCQVALEKGARAARIINGTKPEQILKVVDEKAAGTQITL